MNCTNVQLSAVPDVKGYYKNYIYPNTPNLGFKKHYKEYAKYIKKCLNKKKYKRVLDFGKGDDYLLRCLCDKKKQALAIRPSINKSNKKKLVYPKKFITDFTAKNLNQLAKKINKVDIIIVNDFLANIDNLKSIVAFFKKIASKNCLLFIETSNFNQLLKKYVFDFIYHEHLNYFHKYPLIKFFTKYGFKKIQSIKINTKGGSDRYVFQNLCTHTKCKTTKTIKSKKVKKQFNDKIKSIKIKIQTQKAKIWKLLKKFKVSNCAVYGASATTTAFLINFFSQKLITALVDDNRLKVNKYSPFFNLKVLAASLKNFSKFDCVVIGAWRFHKKIQKKLQSYKGLKINPWPRATIIK